MKITFLGTSHGKPEKNRFCTSTVITVAGKHYIIDAGAPIMDLLQRYEFAFEDIAGIFITHTHLDHIAGLPLFTQAMNSPLRYFDISIPAFIPEAERCHEMFRFIYGAPEFKGRVHYQVYEEGRIFEDEHVRITSIRTQHNECSYAFVIEAEGKRVVFTGDLRKDLSDYPAVILESEKPLDLVVMEAAHQLYDQDYVGNVLKNSRTQRMLIHHVAEHRNPLSCIQSTIEKFTFPAEVAYDGMTVEL